MGTIPSRQNDPEILRRFTAQAKLYSDAKRVQTGRLYVSLALATLAPVLALFVPGSRNVMAIIGGSWALITYFPFRNLQKEKTKQAATLLLHAWGVRGHGQ